MLLRYIQHDDLAYKIVFIKLYDSFRIRHEFIHVYRS